MVRLIIAGVCGRMGGRILSLVRETPGIVVAGGFEHLNHPDIGREVAPGVTVIGDLEPLLERGDVLVDFTEHTATLEHLRVAAKHGTAAVVGTTGFTADEIAEIRSLTSRFPLVLAPNMSVGVTIMFKVLEDMARVLSDYDIEVVEAHHRMKKDAPSGTAIKMADVLARARGTVLDDVAVYARKGHIGQRSDTEIGIQTIRGGDIVGEHTVYFAGPGERMEVTHRAHSRDNFARGAIKAAQWVMGRPNGFYDMQDVLGLRP